MSVAVTLKSMHAILLFVHHHKYDGNTDRDLELVISDVTAGYANCADQGIDGEGHDGVLGDEEQHVAANGYHTTGDAFVAVAVHEQDVDGDINVHADTGEVGTIAQAINRQVAQVALNGRGAAAFKRHRGSDRGGRLAGLR